MFQYVHIQTKNSKVSWNTKIVICNGFYRPELCVWVIILGEDVCWQIEDIDDPLYGNMGGPEELVLFPLNKHYCSLIKHFNLSFDHIWWTYFIVTNNLHLCSKGHISSISTSILWPWTLIFPGPPAWGVWRHTRFLCRPHADYTGHQGQSPRYQNVHSLINIQFLAVKSWTPLFHIYLSNWSG